LPILVLRLDIGLRNDLAELLGLRRHERAGCAGVRMRGTIPCTSSFSEIALSRSAVPTISLKRAITGPGVAAGANNPNQFRSS
jgi:hypothetical protein